MKTRFFRPNPVAVGSLLAAAVLIATPLFVVAPAHAQNPVPNAGKGAKKGGGKGKKETPMQMAEREFARLEKVTGKPLTVVQKATLVKAYMARRASEKAATDTFNATTAQTLGMPVETLKQKYKAVRDTERAAAKSKLKN